MRSFKLSPGDVVSVRRRNGKVSEMYVEDGPYYGEEVLPWVTVAGNKGEVTCAEWCMKRQGWVERK